MTKVDNFVGSYKLYSSTFTKDTELSSSKLPVKFLICQRKKSITDSKPKEFLLYSVRDGRPKYFSSLYPKGLNTYAAEYDRNWYVLTFSDKAVTIKAGRL